MAIDYSNVMQAILNARNDLIETDAQINDAASILARRVLALRSSVRAMGSTLPKPLPDVFNQMILFLTAVEETVNLIDTSLLGYTAASMAQVDAAFDALGLLREEVHPLTDPEVRRQVLAMTDGRCTYCATIVSDTPVEGQSVKLFVEHVVPASKGGPNHLVNYVPSCGSCNSAKGDRHVLHFVRNVQPRRQEQSTVVSIVRAAE